MEQLDPNLKGMVKTQGEGFLKFRDERGRAWKEEVRQVGKSIEEILVRQEPHPPSS